MRLVRGSCPDLLPSEPVAVSQTLDYGAAPRLPWGVARPPGRDSHHIRPAALPCSAADRFLLQAPGLPKETGTQFTKFHFLSLPWQLAWRSSFLNIILSIPSWELWPRPRPPAWTAGASEPVPSLLVCPPAPTCTRCSLWNSIKLQGPQTRLQFG